ncbi:MAG TPA: response regulator, partial [Minicystis sp.]|nr:response regulator [Minicystis sp.]
MASTLLAVDDSVTMRKVLEITFAGPDFRVVAVPNGDAALQKLKSDKPDLVICDLTLESKNGYDVCKAIKQASPSTPVLLLSSKQNP